MQEEIKSRSISGNTECQVDLQVDTNVLEEHAAFIFTGRNADGRHRLFAATT
jgi:hypothetical protein